jgi:hypothetical protein
MNPSTNRSPRQPRRAPWDMDRFLRERAIALGQCVAPATWETYGSALNSYLEFITLHKFLDPEPTPDTLSFFVVFMCHHIKPSSVDGYLSGICQQLEPFFPDIRNSRKSRVVSRTLKGCKRLYNTPTKRKRALTFEDLDRVILFYHQSVSHDDFLFSAMLLTGFFALMRLGELADPDKVALRDPRKSIRRTTVQLTASKFAFFLPGHKGDQFFEGNTVIIPANDSLHDPHRTFVRYLSSRDRLFPLSSALWLREDGTKPTRSWFIRRLHFFFATDVGGQSMRAGGATALAELGTPGDLIQAIGRWKTESFRIYIRKHPVLLHALLFASRKKQ